MQDPSTMDYNSSKDTITDSLNKRCPFKKKCFSANYSNFITKKLSKAIIQ